MSTSTTPSPVSTGAGGTTFEHKVQTEFVCLMISGGKARIERFEDGYLIDNISFQARYRNVETDDMVVTFKPKNGITSRIFAQMKLKIRLTNNTLFNEVIKGFWGDYNNVAVFNKVNDVFAIIMGEPTSMDIYNNTTYLLDRARRCIDHVDFLQKVTAYNNMTELFNTFKNAVEEAKGSSVSDQELWGFLKGVYVISYDYNSDVSRDKRNIIQFLDTAKRRVQGLESASSVWNNLLARVIDDNFKAGVINSDFVFEKYPSLIEWFDPNLTEINPIKHAIDKYKIGMEETILSETSNIDEGIKTLLIQSMEEVYTKLVSIDLDSIKKFLKMYQHPRGSDSNISYDGVGELYELLTYINCKIKNWSIQSYDIANLQLIEEGKSGWLQLIYSMRKNTFPMIIMDLGINLYEKTPYKNYFDHRWIIENANTD
ncbi:ABC-three component system protein, partial [Neobacillus vireti]